MTEIAKEMKELARRINLREVSFMQVLIEMTLKLSPRLVSIEETPPDFESDPETFAALLELGDAISTAFVTQRIEIVSVVATMLIQGVMQGKLGADFFRKVKL
ncbi:MAG: hypothetical protein AAB797_03960 [Patescibacteria group bacterium]